MRRLRTMRGGHSKCLWSHYLCAALALCLPTALGPSAARAADRALYVNPAAGRDSDPGTRARPFRTLAVAQAAARAAAVGATGDLHVWLRGGTYDCSRSPLSFTGADSGRNGCRVLYEAFPGETARLSGGRRIGGWTVYDSRRRIWSAPAHGLDFRQLYVDGRRAVRARWPHRTSDSDLGPYLRLIHWDDHGRTLAVHAADLPADLRGLTSTVEMVIKTHWDVAQLSIAAVSTSGGVTTVTPQEPGRATAFFPGRAEIYHAPGQTFYLENSYDLLGAPGEWFLDREADRAYYIPRPGEDMRKATVIVPVSEDVLDVRGASSLTFQGLTIEYAGWLPPPSERVGLQSGLVFDGTGGWNCVAIPGGVRVSGATDVRFKGCTIVHMGGVGLEISDSTRRVLVDRCHVYDISSVGIWDSSDPLISSPDDPRRCQGDVIRDCSVHDVGRDYTGAGGIVSLYSEGLQILHNEVYNSPYTGISVGAGSTDKPTSLRDNLISGNNVHDVMQLHDDNGGIYTQSLQPGTRITENWVHGIRRSGWAEANQVADVYLDNRSTDITVAHNALSEKWVGHRIKVQEDCGPLTVEDNDDPGAAVMAGPPRGLFSKARTAPPSIAPASYGDSLQTGCFLRAGQFLRGGDYTALMRPDGDFVVCRGPEHAETPIWETGTGGRAPGPYFATVSSRGRLQVFRGTPDRPGAVLWASNSIESPQGYFQMNMQTDGNLTLTPGLNRSGGLPEVWDSINYKTGTAFAVTGVTPSKSVYKKLAFWQ